MILGIVHGLETSLFHTEYFMEVTQQLQPVLDIACILFEEIEGRGAELEQVVTTMEQFLEGPVTEKIIQEFIEKEALAKKQVEETRAKIEEFEAKLPRSK
jgi:hypothetical protein